MKRINRFLSLLTTLAVMISLSGCVGGWQINQGRTAMAKQAQATFNPEALYQVGPKGLWVESVVDISMDPPEETGPIFLLPGTIIGYDEELVR